MIRVCVVDDHPIVRLGLVELLGAEADMTVVAECGDGAAALKAWRRLRPDVVLMDLQMPKMDGFAAIAAIATEAEATGVNTQVLVVTMFESEERILAAIAAGARGYILKASPPEEIVAATRAVASGQTVLSPSLAASLARASVAQAVRPTLTPRESEVLAMVAQGLSNSEVGAHLTIGESTVKTHLANVFEKLGVTDRTHAVTRAMALGLIPGPSR
jgi:DNA-binding NarL/FixJ family response regulator